MPRGPMTLEEFTQECQTLGEQLTANMSPCLEDCGEIVCQQFEENFRSSQQANGQKWPPRKDPLPKHPLLILSGDLKTAATGGVRVVDELTVEAGVMGTIPYAAAQQYGTEHILPRPYININGGTADAIQETIADYIIKQIA